MVFGGELDGGRNVSRNRVAVGIGGGPRLARASRPRGLVSQSRWDWQVVHSFGLMAVGGAALFSRWIVARRFGFVPKVPFGIGRGVG